MLRVCVIAAVFVISSLVSVAIAAPPRTKRDLLIQLADQASANAKAAPNAKDRETWTDWEILYRRLSVLPQAENMSAMDFIHAAEADNENAARQAEAAHQSAAATFWRASHDLWTDLDAQLSRGGELDIRFPEHAMLTPVPGLVGTPWGHYGPTVTPADCASLAQRVQVCQAQFGQMQHEQMTGLYGDQGGPMLMKMHECNQWQELRLAYCAGGPPH